MGENYIRLKRIEVAGFKSIEKMDFELGSINVLIGANGAGKSNLLKSFALFRALGREAFYRYVSKSGGASAILCGGPKKTQKVAIKLVCESSTEPAEIIRSAELSPPDSLDRLQHSVTYLARIPQTRTETATTSAAKVSTPSNDDASMAENEDISDLIDKLVDGFKVYHFMDTTDEAAIRRSCYLHDNKSIRTDGGNLAAVLYRIRRRSAVCYSRIVQTIRQIAPWFGDFVLEPLVDDLKRVQLDWQDTDSEVIYGPHILPDGAIRAIALITLLLQPWEDLPPLLIVDEPELGLHPSAIHVVAALLKQASLHCQVIVATQSPTLLDEFEPKDVIVVDREDGKSTFTRQNPEKLQAWLEEYTLGELWQKNSIGGGPF